jgi:hypothetical protein
LTLSLLFGAASLLPAAQDFRALLSGHPRGYFSVKVIRLVVCRMNGHVNQKKNR